MRPAAAPEFSRPVRTDDLPPSGRSIAASASAHEREALARRLGLVQIARLEVEGEVEAIRGGTVTKLSARLAADVTQTCVVTLAPIDSRIEADFVRLYAAEASAAAKVDEEIFFDEQDEVIEPLKGNRIDAGEAAAEQLALELDPYPRVPGAALPQPAEPAGSGGEEGEAERSRPFADLAERAEARLRKGRK